MAHGWRRGPRAELPFPATSDLICAGRHQNGRSPYWPKTCPAGLGGWRKWLGVLIFRVVSDGNRASRESFDDRTLKQKHIFGAGISNLGSKPPPRMEARNTERMHARWDSNCRGLLPAFRPKHKRELSSGLQDGAGERMIHFFLSREDGVQRICRKMPFAWSPATLHSRPQQPGWAKLIKVLFRIAINPEDMLGPLMGLTISHWTDRSLWDRGCCIFGNWALREKNFCFLTALREDLINFPKSPQKNNCSNPIWRGSKAWKFLLEYKIYGKWIDTLVYDLGNRWPSMHNRLRPVCKHAHMCI